MAEQFYTSLPTAAQFKQDHFEAEVRGMLAMFIQHLDRCVKFFASEEVFEPFSLETTGTSKEAVKILTDYLTKMGYQHQSNTSAGEDTLFIMCPGIGNKSDVDTTVDFFSEHGGKKRKTQA